MAKPVEFELFRNYGKKVKDFLTNHSYLKKYPPNENIQVYYASPPMAFAKYLIPVINGANLNPTIAFYLTGIEYAANENLLGFVKETHRITETRFMVTKPHLVYKLTFKCNIFVSNELDADKIQYQLLTSAPQNRPFAFSILDNQWGTLMATNPSNDTDIAPGEAKDRFIQRSVDLVIPRAYLPLEYELYDGIIKEINSIYETEWDAL
jgi:hypothetical protein